MLDHLFIAIDCQDGNGSGPPATRGPSLECRHRRVHQTHDGLETVPPADGCREKADVRDMQLFSHTYIHLYNDNIHLIFKFLTKVISMSAKRHKPKFPMCS